MTEEMKIAEGMCPCCESEMITYGELQSKDGCVFYLATCDICGATWEEVYELDFVGNQNIHKGAEQQPCNKSK